jgi:hypothetical protein
MDRRSLGSALGASLVVMRCGGGGAGGGSAPQTPAAWNPGEVLLAPGASIDLNPSLPEGVPRNGRFRISERGAALPPGIVLLPDGELRATPAAQLGAVTGVVFEYEYN